MDYQTSAYVAWAIIGLLVALIIYGHFIMHGKPVDVPTKSFRAFTDNTPAPALANINPLYGEDNPINAYEDQLKKGQFDQNGVVIAKAIDAAIYGNGHLSNDDVASHQNYMRRNASKIPRISAQMMKDDTRLTNSTFIGGTRALTMLPIVRPNETRVPDRVQEPMRNLYQGAPPPPGTKIVQ